METRSIKSLAYKVLHGNRHGNKAETKAEINGNSMETFEDKRETTETMFEQYRRFILLATRHQTIEYLEAMEPGPLQIIRDTMQQLDHYFNNRDYQNFMRVITESLKELSNDIYQ